MRSDFLAISGSSATLLLSRDPTALLLPIAAGTKNRSFIPEFVADSCGFQNAKAPGFRQMIFLAAASYGRELGASNQFISDALIFSEASHGTTHRVWAR